MPGYVYVLASTRNGTLYVGSTTNLIQRIYQHKNKLIKEFTSKYNVNQWMYFEEYQDIADMAHREKRIKEWKRSHKIRLIEQKNPNWYDLYHKIIK